MTLRKVAVLPSRTICQDEIEALIAVENQIRAAEEERDRLAADLLARHLSGVEVEPGIYQLDIETEAEGGGREYKLVIR
jgi:hypothetical protein